MPTSRGRRLCLVGLVALLTIVGFAGAAAADDQSGSIIGHFLDHSGQPVPGSAVNVFTSSDQSFVSGFPVNDDGSYAVPDLPAGSYLVEFVQRGITQWVPGQRFESDASPIAVVADAATTVDETAVGAGTLQGTLTNADGTPAAGVFVEVQSPAGSGTFAITDAGGHWSVTVLAADGYVVSFSLDNGLTQFAPHQATQSGAQLFTVADGQSVTIDDQVLPTGTISGRYTLASGAGDAGAFVEAVSPDGSFGNAAQADGNGAYQLVVFPGPFNVEFIGSDNRSQFAFGQLTQDTAAVVNVSAGADTVVNDSHMPTGSVRVSATDAVTGAAIANFCATADSVNACSRGSGVVVLSNVRQGTQTVFVDPHNIKYGDQPGVPVVVTAGQTAAVSQAFQAGAVIKTTIVDAASGQPLAGACVRPFVPGFTVWQDFQGYCSDATGTVKIGPLETGSFTLFTNPPLDSTYGAQWVGANGGTGNQQDARVVKTTAGKTTTIPAIRLDQAGTVTGLVTDAATGAPLTNAEVGPNAFTPGSGVTGDLVPTDRTGHYTLTDLGPYQWPLFADADGYADQWTGGVGNRYQAQTVAVTAGATTTANVALSSGVMLRGTALTADGRAIPGDGNLIVATNARTGDPMGATFAADNGTFSMAITPGQNVRIQYQFRDGTTSYIGYFGGADVDSAQKVHVPAAGTTIHIVLIPVVGGS